MSEKEQFKTWSNNCVKLAEYLETIPDSDHNQSVWISWSTAAACGTVGCALGWAVNAGLVDVPTAFEKRPGRPEIRFPQYPMRWEDVGESNYGPNAFHSIFLNTTASRIDTINALYAEAKRLCKLAGGGEQT